MENNNNSIGYLFFIIIIVLVILYGLLLFNSEDSLQCLTACSNAVDFYSTTFLIDNKTCFSDTQKEDLIFCYELCDVSSNYKPLALTLKNLVYISSCEFQE